MNIAYRSCIFQDHVPSDHGSNRCAGHLTFLCLPPNHPICPLHFRGAIDCDVSQGDDQVSCNQSNLEQKILAEDLRNDLT